MEERFLEDLKTSWMDFVTLSNCGALVLPGLSIELICGEH
jgi:hypothetical protein